MELGEVEGRVEAIMEDENLGVVGHRVPVHVETGLIAEDVVLLHIGDKLLGPAVGVRVVARR